MQLLTSEENESIRNIAFLCLTDFFPIKIQPAKDFFGVKKINFFRVKKKVNFIFANFILLKILLYFIEFAVFKYVHSFSASSLLFIL